MRREKGATPEQISNDCYRKGKLLAIDRDPFLNGVRKYFKYGDDERPMEITVLENKVVSARRVPATVLKTLPPLNPPEFGNF